MSNDFENRSTHIIHENGQVGSVQIADEVIAIIAGLAATEVEGVASIEDRSANELAGRLGMKTAPKGVKVTVMDTSVSCDLSLNLKYGYSIPELALNVQEHVKTAIENMTGLAVIDVNVRIAGIEAE
ncbi:MAG: Asp23/Gls24 family envelope stress response protein [Lachnospiraceae bacterium]|nr:Asp23/Gls24 family envelope stress response protein [Lachnospiraceae bacterium]